MLDKTATYTFTAQPFLCDFSGHLSLSALGNQLLNCAEQHASQRGFGMTNLAGTGTTWMLARLAIEMKTMPNIGTTYQIETWIENVHSFFTNRNFTIIDTNHQPIGYARSFWIMVNTTFHNATDLTAYKQLLNYQLPNKPCPIEKPTHRNTDGEPLPTTTTQMHYSDIDMNQHVNSIKYIEHILNLFPINWHQTHYITRFEITYINQSHADDTLKFVPSKTIDNTYNIKVDNSKNNIRVCRAQIRTITQ